MNYLDSPSLIKKRAQNMKGIAGIVYPTVYKKQRSIDSMLSIINPHKDQHWYYHQKNVSLASSQHAYSCEKQKDIALIFSGNLLNQKDLENKLITAGYQATDNPATLLARAYDLWNKEFMKELMGDFAIALLDLKKQRLLLIRDRVGEQSLYWFSSNSYFMFGSNIKSLLISGMIPQTPAIDALSAYLSLSYIPQDMSPIKDINRLLPGYYLEYNLKGKVSIHPYWSYSACFGHAFDEQGVTDPVDELNRQLNTGIERRIGTVYPSSPIYSLLERGSSSFVLAKHLQDYASVIPVSPQVQQKSIREDALSHLQVDPNLLSLPRQSPKHFLVKLIWYLGEPMADPTLLHFWNISRELSNTTNTLFTSLGSDIILGTCTRYFSKKLTKPIPYYRLKKSLLKYLQMVNRSSSLPILRELNTPVYLKNYINQETLFDQKSLKEASPLLAPYFNPHTFIQKFYKVSECPSEHLSAAYFDFKTQLVDKFLVPRRTILQQFNVTLQSPFLDSNIIDYCASFHSHYYKDKDYYSSFPGLFLQKTFSNPSMPPLISTESEEPYSLLLLPEIQSMFPFLLKGMLCETGIIQVKWLKKTLEQKYHNDIPTLKKLWGLLCLEIWFRLFIHAPLKQQAPNTILEDFLS